MAPGAKVQASKLSPHATEVMIRTLFEQIGPLENLVLIPSPLGAGYEAIIEFTDPCSASTATHLTGTLFAGRALSITLMDVTILSTSTTGSTTATTTRPMPQAGAVLSHGNNMIRMGATINHPQFNAMPGMGLNMTMGNQFQPIYSSPHITLYNPNVMPPQFHQSRMMMDQQQPVDLDKLESKRVYVGNLPLTVTKEQLEEVFQDCGKITSVNIAGKPTHPTRFAFIEFETLEATKKALSSTNKMIGDRTLRINVTRNQGPLPFMLQQAQMMQIPVQSQPVAPLDAARTKQKNILIGLINRGGADPALSKMLEELEAGGPIQDLSSITGLSPSLATLSTETASPKTDGPAPPMTAASLLEKLVSSSRRMSRSRSRTRRRSRSRSVDREYYKSSRRRRSPSRSQSRSRYSRSSRYDSSAEYGRYGGGGSGHSDRDRERERDRDRASSRSSRGRGYEESGRDREREREGHRDRERERERERGRDRPKDHERERERDRDKDRHRESDRSRKERGHDRGRTRPESDEKRSSEADVQMKSPTPTPTPTPSTDRRSSVNGDSSAK